MNVLNKIADVLFGLWVIGTGACIVGWTGFMIWVAAQVYF